MECACRLVPEVEAALQNVRPSFVCLSCQGCYVKTNLFLLRIAKEVTSLAVPPCKSSKAWQQNVSAVCLLLETWQQNVSAVCLLLEAWPQNVSAVCLLLEADGDVCMLFLVVVFSQCASSFGI